MMKSMTLNPATFAPAFGMPACGHALVETGVPAVIPAALAALAQRVPTRGHVSDFAGKRNYAARVGSSWRPSHC